MTEQEPSFTLMLPDAVNIDTVVLYSGYSGNDEDKYNAHTFVIEAMPGADWVEVARVEGNLQYRCAATFNAVKASAWRVRFIKANNMNSTSDYAARIFEVRLLQAK